MENWLNRKYEHILNVTRTVLKTNGTNVENFYLSGTLLCVVVDKLNERKIDTIKTLRRSLFVAYDLPLALDIFIYEKEEFERKSKVKGSIEKDFKENGKILK